MAVLLIGFLFYSRFVARIFGPFTGACFGPVMFCGSSSDPSWAAMSFTCILMVSEGFYLSASLAWLAGGVFALALFWQYMRLSCWVQAAQLG